MIMHNNEEPKRQVNPFEKVTVKRGFNQTPDDIRNNLQNGMMKPTVQDKNNPNHPNFDPSKQREAMVSMNRMRNDFR